MFLNDIEIPGWFRRLPATRELIQRHEAEQAKADVAERKRLQAERAVLLAEQEKEMAKLIAVKAAANEEEKKAKAAYDAAIEASRRAWQSAYAYSHSSNNHIGQLEARLLELTHPAIQKAGAQLSALLDGIRLQGSYGIRTESETNIATGSGKVVATNVAAIDRRLGAIQAAATAIGELQFRDVARVDVEVARILSTIPDGIHSPMTSMEKVA
jgi:hypothetical protein